MSRSVKLTDCGDLFEYFPVIFSGWQITEIQQDIENPIVTMCASTQGYELTAEWLSEPQRCKNKANAICAFVSKMVRAYIDDDQNLLCLHGAAAEFGGSLVVFPSKFRSGKSVLSACLAYADVKIFCDDVLLVDLEKGQGIAAGLAPRLRLLLPGCLSGPASHF